MTSHLPILGIDELRKDRFCPERICAVYFLWNGESLIYVGSSRDVMSRIGRHSADKDFDSVSVVRVPPEQLLDLESQYIAAYLPSLNRKAAFKDVPSETATRLRSVFARRNQRVQGEDTREPLGHTACIRVALQANADPRSVQRVWQGRPIRGAMLRERIEAALKQEGLLPAQERKTP